MLIAIAQVLSSFGVFSSRAFIPALVAALLVRFGGEWALLQEIGLSSDQLPPWFTHNITIGVLGLLAALEFVAHRSADARRLLAEVDHWAKPVMAGLVTFGLLSADDARAAGLLLGAAELPGMHQAGLTDALPAMMSALGTYWAATTRNALLRDVQDADHNDDTGFQRLFTWAEELWAAFGVVLMLLYPLVMAALVACVLVTIYVLRKRAEQKEDAGRTYCPKCGTQMYRSAVACPKCLTTNTQVHGLTWLGTTSRERTHDRESHPFVLASKKRCRRCANRLRQRTPALTCRECHLTPFADPTFVRRYDQRVLMRMPFVLAVVALLSAVPVVGLIPGVMLYRLQLVAPYRRYIPAGADLLSRWFLRLLFLALAIVQFMPAVGVFAVPLMALANWAVYRRGFLKRAAAVASTTTTPMPAPPETATA